MKLTFKLLTLAMVLSFGGGCVSMQEYQDRMVEISQLKKVIRDTNSTIQAKDDQNTSLAKNNETLKKENKGLKVRNWKLKKALTETKQSYDRIFKKKMAGLVKFDQDKDFKVNPQTGGIVLEGDIYFSSGSARLKGSGKRLLNKLVTKLSQRKYKKFAIEVAGHTDSDPLRHTKKKYKDNYLLSAVRAHSVLRYIISRGVPKSRVFISGHGYNKPRSSNANKTGKKKNRRVEIVLRQS